MGPASVGYRLSNIEELSIKILESIRFGWIDIWYELSWFKTGPKLLGLLRPEKPDNFTAEYFFLACERVKELRENVKIAYEIPLSLDAFSIAKIIDLYAQTICFRTLASRGKDWALEIIQDAILEHEKMLNEFGKEPKSSQQAIQVAISKAMIFHGKDVMRIQDEREKLRSNPTNET